MSSETRTFDNVKDIILSAHKNISPADKIDFYNKWAEDYDNVRWLFGRIDTLLVNSWVISAYLEPQGHIFSST